MRAAATILALTMAPAQASAEAPCPTWSERQTVDCMRGYVRVNPLGLAIRREEVGYATEFGAGLFRNSGRFGAALGVRLGYGLLPRSQAEWRTHEHFLSAGPELRLGLALQRVFGYLLARGGYSHRIYNLDFRTSIINSHESGGGWHAGGGAGAWGRLGRRLLVGGEVAVDLIEIKDRGRHPVVSLSLTVGAWL